MHTLIKHLHKSPSRKLRILNAGAYEAARGVDFPFHRHTAWELVYYRLGNVNFRIGGEETVPVGPGVLLFAPPHIPHSEIALTAYANFHLLIDARLDISWPRLCFDDVNQTLNRLCAQIVDEFGAAKPRRSSMLELLAAQLAIALDRAVRATHIPLPERIVGKAEILIANNFTRSLRISEIARQCGTSPASLRAYFARLRGCSPLAHMQKVRLQHAWMFLTTSDVTLDRIAELSGYDSASHLSRHVKRACGKSPGSLRHYKQR